MIQPELLFLTEMTHHSGRKTHISGGQDMGIDEKELFPTEKKFSK